MTTLSPSEAALALGQIYLDDDKPAQAIESFQRAARDGNAAALNMLGRIHERGWGVEPDPAVAAAYFTKAANANDVWAMFNLADLYLLGRGVAQSDAKAHHLYASAASLGHSKSLNMLGIMAEEGRGPDTSSRAQAYFLAAAKAGDVWAQFNLARRMIDAKQIAQAIPWLELSLQKGFAEYWRMLAHSLAEHGDERLRQIATRAATLLGSESSPV